MARTRTKAGDVSAKRGEDEFLSDTRPKVSATGRALCEECEFEGQASKLKVVGIGTWECPNCKHSNAHSWDVVVERKLTGEFCADCFEPQFESRGGVVCKNGHGGAESLSRDEAAQMMLVRSKKKSSERSEDFPPPQRTTDRIVAEVTASSGEMKISMDNVQKYGSISVGPFFVKLVVAEGETPADALRRAREIADAQLVDAARTKAKAFSKIVDEIEGGR